MINRILQGILAESNSTTVPPGPIILTGDVTFLDSYFWYSYPSYTKTNFVGRSPASYIEFTTEDTTIDLKIASDWISTSFPAQSKILVLVDGTLHAQLSCNEVNTVETKTVSLPAGLKTVRVINGYAANTATLVKPANCTSVIGAVINGSATLVKPESPAEKWLFVGDSITTGASCANPTLTSFSTRFRDDNINVQLDSWGDRRLLTYPVDDANTMAAFISSEMNAINTNLLITCFGTNNFGIGGGQTKAVFKTSYLNYVEALHTIRPDLRVYCLSPIQRTDIITNGAGATQADYRDAINEVCALYPTYTTFINAYSFVSTSNLTDGLHPNEAGHLEYYENLKGVLLT